MNEKDISLGAVGQGPPARLGSRGEFRRAATDASGVTPVVTTMLLIVVMLVIVAAVIAWSVPYIQDKQDQTSVRTYLGNVHTLQENLQRSIWNGPGYQIGSTFNYVDSELAVEGRSEVWLIYYSHFPTVNVTFVGLTDGDSVFEIRTEGQVSYESFDLAKCRAKLEYIDPEPVLAEPVEYLSSGPRFNAPAPLDGFIRITILLEETPVSEAWLFPQGTLEQKLNTQTSIHYFSISNGALLSSYPSGRGVRTGPFIREDKENGVLSLTMVDLRAKKLNRIGSGNFQVSFEAIEPYVLTETSVYNMKVVIEGEWTEAWYLHFEKEYNDFKGGHSKFAGFYPARVDGRLEYLFPKKRGIEKHYPNDIELKIARYVVECDIEAG